MTIHPVQHYQLVLTRLFVAQAVLLFQEHPRLRERWQRTALTLSRSARANKAVVVQSLECETGLYDHTLTIESLTAPNLCSSFL